MLGRFRGLILFLSFGFVVEGCKPRNFNSEVADFTGAASKSETAAAYLPIGDWTGRLILPKPGRGQNKAMPIKSDEGERRPDGGVFLEVHNAPAPYADLKGQTIWLTYSPETSVQARYRRIFIDVEFNDSTTASLGRGNKHPFRINYWKAVSPLESMAGARETDDVEVKLKNVTVSADKKTVYTDREPVMIVGREVALVTFLGPQAGTTEHYRVKHWGTGNFNGAEEVVYIPNAPRFPKFNIPASSVRGIENSQLNSFGWYLYGERTADGKFKGRAIEPRKPMLPTPTTAIRGKKASADFVRHGLWKAVYDAKTPEAMQKIIGSADTFLLRPDDAKGYVAPQWNVGDKHILIHVYGNVGGPAGEGPTFLNVSTGHYSYGFAEVIEDRFTKEKRFDIEYKQVYAHNKDYIVAGSQAWHNYMGSFVRGWGHLRSTADAILYMPAVDKQYKLPSRTLNPHETFEFALENIMGRYRTGNGDGSSNVTGALSCVQDSNQALFVALGRLDSDLTTTSVTGWLASKGAEVERFKSLLALQKDIEAILAPLGGVRADWKENRQGLSYGVPAEQKGWVGAIQSWKTLFPRTAFDEISVKLLENGGSLFIQRPIQIGGRIDGIEPFPPNSPLNWK